MRLFTSASHLWSQASHSPQVEPGSAQLFQNEGYEGYELELGEVPQNNSLRISVSTKVDVWEFESYHFNIFQRNILRITMKHIGKNSIQVTILGSLKITKLVPAFCSVGDGIAEFFICSTCDGTAKGRWLAVGPAFICASGAPAGKRNKKTSHQVVASTFDNLKSWVEWNNNTSLTELVRPISFVESFHSCCYAMWFAMTAMVFIAAKGHFTVLSPHGHSSLLAAHLMGELSIVPLKHGELGP